jgi:hypothetical protein
MRIFMLMAAAAAIAGCAVTPEERAAQVQADVDRMIATYGPACDRLGYKANDDKWRDCVMRLAARDERRYSYYRYPVTTSCFGHRGFYHCTSF